MNIIKPRRIKLIASFMKSPYFIAGAQAFSSSLRVAYLFPSRGINIWLKSSFPMSLPIGGIKILSTKDFTTFAKAAQKINHTAISTAFPFIRKFLKSFNIQKKIKKII